MKTNTKMRTVLILALGMATEVVNADFTFGEPKNLGPTINTSNGDGLGSLSADGLEIYFDALRPGGRGSFDLWVAKRPTTDDDWGTPENLGSAINTGGLDVYPNISADGLELYFCRNEAGDIWVSTRASTDDDWGNPVKLGPVVNTAGKEYSPSISSDGLELYFTARNRTGGHGSDDIWVARRATKSDPWESATNLGAVVNTSASEAAPSLSADGLALFFSEDTSQPLRPGGYGNLDMWITRRTSVSEPWGTPVNLGPIVNTASLDGGPRMSADGFTLYFNSTRPGGFGGLWGDIWQAPIMPVVDFNGDYTVDIDDLTLLIDHWGQNEPAFDMGPTPLGDGVVDTRDLEVLMSYWGQKLHDPHFITHLKLDETEGMFAADSVSEYDAIVLGSAVWRPEGGHIQGCLEFDGNDDLIGVQLALNPSEGPFSVFAWIKGGAPGQVIVSHEGGVDWLLVDPQNGYLMTEIKGKARGTSVMISETMVTDGHWHRIGLVWDGTHRSLYVDDELVATDSAPQGSLSNQSGGLRIGTGSRLEPGTFWSGLIDDVRIYDRVVTP